MEPAALATVIESQQNGAWEMKRIVPVSITLIFWVGAAWAGWLGESPALLHAPEDGADQSRWERSTTHSWLGPDGRPLPFRSDEDVLEFLERAEVVSAERFGVGINRIYRVLLEKDGTQARAAFRHVKLEKSFHKPKRIGHTLRKSFRDDNIFELAAYRLSRLLGLRNVPPTVSRNIDGKNGTLQIWVERAMMEKERQQEKIPPPVARDWINQWQIRVLFDNLIFNDDRNQGNILIDSNWKVWLIDHTRSFRLVRALPSPETIRHCGRDLWDRLRSLDKSTLETRLGGILRKSEIRSLLHRRDLLLAHLQKLIDQKGEAAVLL